MMKKSPALCLILCALLLSACSTFAPAPTIVKNEVPENLLNCAPEPEKPSFRTGSDKLDFQNITIYSAKVKEAGADCRSKIAAVRELINQPEKIPAFPWPLKTP